MSGFAYGKGALLLVLAFLIGLAHPGVAWSDSGGVLGSSSPVQSDHSPALELETPEIRGELFPARFTTLASEIPARIRTLSVKEGAHFAKGKTLVTLDCTVEKARLTRAKAVLKLAQAKADIHTRLSRYEATSELEIHEAQGEVAKAQAEQEIILAKLQKCRIHAPFSGQVVALQAREHQYVKAGDPLLDIQDGQNLEVHFLISSLWISRIRVGDPFTIHLEELDKTFAARVRGFGARIDAVSQSIKVIGTLKGKGKGVVPGMSGRVHISPDHHTQP
ncbi:MAG: efflux RND transporter periplasmic adaptor subunit [Magnetococcales bacterium]|nr:efflux RND transporter periplasmic adaptor subunit [Magnetococcales bacterium]